MDELENWKASPTYKEIYACVCAQMFDSLDLAFQCGLLADMKSVTQTRSNADTIEIEKVEMVTHDA